MSYNDKTLLSLVIVNISLHVSGILNISDCFGQELKINTVLKIKENSLAEVNPKDIWRHDSSNNLPTVAFSPDSKFLACGEGGSIEIWNWKSQILTGELKLNAPIDPNSYLRSIAFSPNGKYLAAGGLGDNFLSVWDISTKKPVLASCGYHGLWSEYDLPIITSVGKAVFTPDSRLLITETRSKIRIWDILEGEDIYTFYDLREFAISPNGTTLATYNHNDNNSSIVFWDLKTKKNIGKISTDDIVVFDMCFSPNGKSLAYSTKKLIIICDIQKMEETVRLENNGYVMNIQYFPCGQYLLCLNNKTAFTRNTNEPWQVYVDVIDITNYEILKRYKAETLSTKIKTPLGNLIYDPRGIFLKTVLSPDGQNIAICCEGGKILLWKTPEMFLNKVVENLDLED